MRLKLNVLIICSATLLLASCSTPTNSNVDIDAIKEQVREEINAENSNSPPSNDSSSPQPSSVPSPTPTPTPEPTPTPVPTVTVKIKAAIIKNSGEIIPVPRTPFIVTPYSLKDIRNELLIKNDPGPSPEPPEFSDYTPTMEDMANGIFASDYEGYDRDKKLYDEKLLPEWKAKAYAGEEQAIKEASGDRESQTVTTDLSGETTITLTMGKWYFTSSYEINNGKSNIFWQYIPIEINENTEKVEFSNDNGEVINL